MDARVGVAHAGITEERLELRRRWLALKRRNTAIDVAMIPEVLVAESNVCGGAGGDGERRIHARPLETRSVTEATGVLVHSVESRCDSRPKRLANVQRPAPVVKRSTFEPERTDRREPGL